MPDQEKKYPFEFTALPHVFTDFWMPLLSPTAIVTMMALYRATIGWQQVEAAVSFPKLAVMTGIASYDTLTQDLEELMNAGLIQRKGEKGKQRTIIYQLMQNALTFTDFVKWLQEQMQDKTFTDSVKQPLQNPKRPFFRKRKDGPGKSVKVKMPQVKRQSSQEKPPTESEQGAKETLLKETFLNKEKDIPPQAKPSAGADAPFIDLEENAKEEEKNAEPQAQATLGNDTAGTPSKPAKPTKTAEQLRQEEEGRAAAALQLQEAREQRERERAEKAAKDRREMAALAIQGYQRDLDKAQARYNQLQEQGADERTLQSADDDVRYWKRMIADEEAKL